MSQVYNILSQVPPTGNTKTLVPGEHITNDIIDNMLVYHKKHRPLYDRISEQYWKGNADKTGENLFNFLKRNVSYSVEPDDWQTIKAPGRLLSDAHGDCKHYAGFITGIVDSLNRKGYPIKSRYRFVADTPDKEVHHVFAVVEDNNGNIFWCDPVLSEYNNKPRFYNSKEAAIGSTAISGVYYLSGTQASEVERVCQPDVLILFMRQHGVTPNHFTDAQHVARWAAHHIKYPNDNVSPDNFRYDYSDSDKQPQIMGNIFTKIAHGLKVDAANLKHSVKVNEANLQKSVKVNTANAGKMVKQAAHAVAVNAANAEHAIARFSLPVARGAFLGMVALNTFNMAKDLRSELQSGNRHKLLNKWNVLGGKQQGLINAVNNGFHVYMNQHGGWNNTMNISGIHGPEIAAGAAAPIIAALKEFLHFITSNPNVQQAVQTMTQQGISNIANNISASINKQPATPGFDAANALEAVVQPGASMPSMSVSTGLNDAGEPVMSVDAINNAPALDENNYNNGTVPVATQTATLPQVQVTSDKSTDLISNPKQTIKDYMTTIENFFSAHKTLVIGGVAALVLIKGVHKKRGKWKFF